jgi:hypothetical protein
MRRSAAAPRFCPGANYQRHFATREAESRSRAMRVPRKQRAGAARALRAPERLPFGVSSARERASADLVGTGKVQGRYREGTGKVQGERASADHRPVAGRRRHPSGPLLVPVGVDLQSGLGRMRV